MRPLFQLKTIKDLSLREADEIVGSVARMGYGGLILPRDGDWDTVRGFCRAAGKHKLRLWLRDDPGFPSGGFGGEVTSVPAYRPEFPELWGCRIDSADAAEAFLDCSYKVMRRELKRFLGYELTGVVTGFSGSGLSGERAEAFLGGQLGPIADFCRENKLELLADTDCVLPGAEEYADTGIAFASLDGLTMAARLGLVCGLAAGGRTGLAAQAEPYPDFMEEVWCGAAEKLFALTESSPEPLNADLPESVAAVRFGDKILVYNAGEAERTMVLDPGPLKDKYITGLGGGLYLPPESETSLTLAGGGFILLLPAEGEAGPLPPFLDSGAVVGEYETEASLVPILSGHDENRLPLELKDGRAEFEVRHPSENQGIRVEAESFSYLRINGTELSESNVGDPGGPIIIGGGVLRMGTNVLETDGTEAVLYGGFSTDGEALVSPTKPGPGDVRAQGLARYDGPLVYRAALPEDCGGKYFLPEGSFGCALVKIARRRLRLLEPPFAVSLLPSDRGGTAEIIIFPQNDRKNVPFGLDSVKIVRAKG